MNPKKMLKLASKQQQEACTVCRVEAVDVQDLRKVYPKPLHWGLIDRV